VTAEIARRAARLSDGRGRFAANDRIRQENFSGGKVSELAIPRDGCTEIKFERQFDLLFSNRALHWVETIRRFCAARLPF